MKAIWKAIWPAVLGFVVTWVILDFVKYRVQTTKQNQEIHQLAVESFTGKFQEMESDIKEQSAALDTTDVVSVLAFDRHTTNYLNRTLNLYTEIYEYIKKSDISDKYPEEYEQMNDLLSAIFNSQVEVGRDNFTLIGVLKKETDILHELADTEEKKAMIEVLKIDPCNQHVREIINRKDPKKYEIH